jgi:MFS family permease
MFTHRGFAVGMGIALVFFLGVASFGLVLTLFLQQGLGFTPLHAGATFIPFAAGVFLASGGAARLEPRFGRGVTMSGAPIMAAAMAVLIGIVHHYGAAVSTWDLTPGLALAGLGLGTVIAPLANVVLADVREQDAGSASGVLNTGFQLGNSIGLALMGVIFIDQLAIGPAPRCRGSSPPRPNTRCGSRSASSCWPSCLCSPCRPDAVTTGGPHPSESTTPDTRGIVMTTEENR